MLLRVGELAKRCGLTVRTLHYYEEIGLLLPSARSDAGYRLYNRIDIARLHQIQAMRRMGLPLTEIGTILARPDTSLSTVIEQQINMLDRQIAQTANLRGRLVRLRAQFIAGSEPDLADWLTTMELMTMYDKYFSQEELAQLPFLMTNETRHSEWSALVAEVDALMQAGVPAQSEQAQLLSRRWMLMLESDTAANPKLLVQLNAMHLNEPAMQAQTGISSEMADYVLAAFAESKLVVYQKYLSPAEFAYMRKHYGQRMKEWPPLIAEVRQEMALATAPDDPKMQRLAQRWLELFRAYAGDDPATHLKIRNALANEPSLLAGTWVTPEVTAFLGKAMASLSAA
ncbi:MerR family transcriptional regulator [Paraherbaspirillum soli]|uniref:MerR family transcriptional regulator n=1 Tax=Paraherbaspirillum soli TaxID=631222 RepID=A0ABW0MDT6_9BURK